MSSARRPGRVQKIAYDATPLSSSKPDIDARIGWLLAMSRLHHADPAMADGRAFVAALRDVDGKASRSLVSRWESGEIPISYEGMLAYERALDLQTGQISSLTGYVRASLPGLKARVVRPLLDPSTDNFSARLDTLIEMAEDGEASAPQWQELGWHLAAVPLVHLRATTWETLSARLINVLPRSVKVPYRQYSTAVMNMASVPRARDFLTDAVVAHVRRPHAQVLTNPIGLLDQLPTRRAAKLTLDLIEDPPTDSVFALAVWVAAQKIKHGAFTPEERGRLDMLVLQMWRSDPVKASDELPELIASLPEGLRSTLTNAASRAGRARLGHVVETGEHVPLGMAHGLTRDIAEAARSQAQQKPAYEEDRMLARLVREALFHRDSERRHLAALFIAASPFNDAVADELLGLLTGDWPAVARQRAAVLVRYLSTDVHRLRMLGFVEDRQSAVSTALVQGVGHMTFTDFSDQVIRSSLRPEWSPLERAKMYALGMTGSPALTTLTRSPNTPAWQKDAATWWLTQGAAVRS
jgi:hypothetical protein